MKTTILLLLLLSTTMFFGQNDSGIDNKICIKAAPLALLDIYSGMSPRIGIEYKLKNNFALYNEIGTYIPNPNSMYNNHGILTKLEFKFYLNRENFTNGPYLSAELFYKFQSYGTYDTIIIAKTKYQQDYTVKKNITCFTIKVGTLSQFDNGLTLDPFIGLGIRHRDIASTLTSEENNNIQPDSSPKTNESWNKAGIFNVLNFDMGVKIGYRIK